MRGRERSPRSASTDGERVILPFCFSLAFLLGICLSAGLLSPLEGQRSLEIENFRVTVKVDEDASIRVMESITVRFNGEWNGFYRTIPVEYQNPQGFSYRLFLDVEDVRDDAGNELRTELSRERGYRKIKIWVPGCRRCDPDPDPSVHAYPMPSGSLKITTNSTGTSPAPNGTSRFRKPRH